jgi:hypothetical protein
LTEVREAGVLFDGVPQVANLRHCFFRAFIADHTTFGEGGTRGVKAAESGGSGGRGRVVAKGRVVTLWGRVGGRAVKPLIQRLLPPSLKLRRDKHGRVAQVKNRGIFASGSGKRAADMPLSTRCD